MLADASQAPPFGDEHADKVSVHSRFALELLLVAAAFVASTAWAWHSSGPLGAACLLVFITLVLANVGIVWWSERLRCPVLAGVLGGVFLWLKVAAILDTIGIVGDGVYPSFLLTGVVAGLVCGGYARLRHLQVDNGWRKAMLFAIVWLIAIATVCGTAILIAYWQPILFASR